MFLVRAFHGHSKVVDCLFMRKAKILATLGPASSTQAIIEKMIESGLNAVRINMSHGTHEEHTAASNAHARPPQNSNAARRYLSIFPGPKIRTPTLKDGQPVDLARAALFTITTRDIVGDRNRGLDEFRSPAGGRRTRNTDSAR